MPTAPTPPLSIPAGGGVVFEQVSKRYGAVTAVDAVSFQVAPGTLTTLLGPSGCGKTSTLRLVAGLEMASSGRILIGAQDVTHRPASARDVSLVFQSYALFPHLSVLDNVCYGLLAQHSPREAARRQALAMLEQLGLQGLQQRLPAELSGGQQQRVALARALVLQPQVLLFDEPLSNLDAKLRRRVRQEIRTLQQTLKLTVLYVTHDQGEALAVSDHIIVMDRGRIAQQGSPQQLYQAPASRFIADFIGDANLAEGRLQREGDTAWFSAAGQRLALPATTACADGPATLVLRPHQLQVVAPGQGRLDARLRRCDDLGGHRELTLDTPWGEWLLIALADGQPLPAPGEPLGLAFDPRHAIVLPAER